MKYIMTLIFYTRRMRKVKITGCTSLPQAEKKVLESLGQEERIDLKFSEIISE